MFNIIKNWIKNGVKSAKESDEIMDDVKSNICKFESDTSDCSLIQELKSKQAMKKIVDADIRAYENHSNENIQKFLHFLIALEKNGFTMNNAYSTRMIFPVSEVSDIRDMFICEGTYRLEKVLDSFSLDDIDDIANELKALKQKITIVEEKRTTSKALAKDISDIKTKLGID